MKNKLMIVLSLVMLSFFFQSCEFPFDEEDKYKVSDLVGTWYCENAVFEGFDNIAGACTISFADDSKVKSFSIKKEFEGYYRTYIDNYSSNSYCECSGEWLLDQDGGMIYTTSKYPSSFSYFKVGEAIYHTYSLSHGGENIVFSHYERTNPLTLVIDGNTFTKQ